MNERAARDIAHAILGSLAPATVDLSDDRYLDELGIDSLDRVALAVMIEERIGTEVSDPQLAGIHTVADVIDALGQATGV